MKDLFPARWVCILAAILGMAGTVAAAQSNSIILLPAATVHRPYSYQIATTQPSGTHAKFTIVPGSNARWLNITSSGLLTGTPDKTPPAQSAITVQIAWDDGSPPISGSFVVPLNKVVCPSAAEQLALCELKPNVPTTEDLAQDRFVNEATKNRIQLKDPGQGPDHSLNDVTIVQFNRIKTKGTRGGPYNKGVITPLTQR
jgi:hypothetical protein